MCVVLRDGFEGLVKLAALNLNRAYSLNTCIAFTQRHDFLVVLERVAAEITAHRGHGALTFYAVRRSEAEPTLYVGQMSDSSGPPSGSRERRIAFNEAFCRDLNERKAQWIESGQVVAGFRCECWQVDCSERLQISSREWHEVRSRSNRFAVVPGHIAAEHEAVVKEYPHLWLIEKHGEAGDVAEELA